MYTEEPPQRKFSEFSSCNAEGDVYEIGKYKQYSNVKYNLSIHSSYNIKYFKVSK